MNIANAKRYSRAVYNNENVANSLEREALSDKIYEILRKKTYELHPSYFVDLATHKDVLSSGAAVQIVSIYDEFMKMGLDFYKCYDVCCYRLSTLKSENIKEILYLIKKYKKIFKIENSLWLFGKKSFGEFENKELLLEKIYQIDDAYQAYQIITLSIYCLKTLGNQIFDIIEIIKEYENRKRKDKAVAKMIDGLLNDEKNRDVFIETFDYFKDYKPSMDNTCIKDDSYEQKNGIFSCLDLWGDLSIDSEFELLKKEILALSEENRGRALTKARGVVRRMNISDSKR